MPDTPVLTRSQRWAQLIFDKVDAASRQSWSKDYGRQCVHLPALIHQSGLCQTLAFLEAKAANKKRPWVRRLLDDLAAVHLPSSESARSLDLSDYQRYTLDALRCAEWFKRYAEAILKVDVADRGKDR